MKILLIIILPFIVSCNLFDSGNFKKAREAEVTGKMDEALGLYVETLHKTTSSVEIPDVSRSKFVEPALWKKEIEKHIVWLHMPAERIHQDYHNSVEGVLRCIEKVHTENSLAKVKVSTLKADQYASEWKSLFYAPLVQPDLSVNAIIEKNFADKFSIIKISTPKNYTYEISLYNKASGKRTYFKIYPESNNAALVLPGEYLIICRSTITFQTNQVWYSKYSVFPITVPDQASIITAELRTSVAKERER